MKRVPSCLAQCVVSIVLVLLFLLQNPKASMPFTPGYEEDKFLQSLGITKDDIEPKAKNCTEV